MYATRRGINYVSEEATPVCLFGVHEVLAPES